MKTRGKVNMLLNIANYYGNHSGKMKHVILYMVVVSIPWFAYIMLGIRYIDFKYFLIIEVLFAIRMAFLILLDEKGKLIAYTKAINSEYAESKDLVKVFSIKPDGLIEYMNGEVAYIISAFPKSYFSDKYFSKKMEDFLSALDKYDYKIILHNVTKETSLCDSLESLNTYKDPEFIKERIDFYKRQDQYCNDKSIMYRYSFLIKTYKRNKETLRSDIAGILAVGEDGCFRKIDLVKSVDECKAIMERDLCAYIDLNEILTAKYDTDDTYGTKIIKFNLDEEEEDVKEG